MKKLVIVLFADFNSAFARDWARSLEENDVEVHSVSSNKLKQGVEFECVQPSNAMASLKRLVASKKKSKTAVKNASEKITYTNRGSINSNISLIRELFAFLNTLSAARILRKEVKRTNPDLVHAMRSTFEGVVADIALPSKVQLAVSIWGNDFTLHCTASQLTTMRVKSVLKRVKGIHADAAIDLERASKSYSLNSAAHKLHAPTSGGVPTNELRLDISKLEAKVTLGIPGEKNLIINPRGTRSYISSEVFFEAAEADSDPNNIYLAIDVPPRPGWFDYENSDQRYLFSKSLDRDAFFILLRAADIAVSPSRYDGTPNSVLEAMGSGAYVLLTDIKSTNDLVDSDKQRVIFDVDSAASLSSAIDSTLTGVDLPEAARLNESLVNDKHSRLVNAKKTLSWYRLVVNS